MVFPWFSHGFLWFSYGFPMVSSGGFVGRLTGPFFLFAKRAPRIYGAAILMPQLARSEDNGWDTLWLGNT